jgi:hypothetical protein
MDGPTLSIHARPSRRLFLLLAALHGGALLAPWATGLPLPLRLAASLAALPGSLRLLRKWREDAGGWLIGYRDGAWSLAAGGPVRPAGLLEDTVVWEHLLVLRLRADGRSHSLVLLADSCPPDELRRLRVVLRMRAPFRPGRAA